MLTMADDRLHLETACCGRRVRSALLYRSATTLVLRTCPKCGTRYNVKLAPRTFLVHEGSHATLTDVTWFPLEAG